MDILQHIHQCRHPLHLRKQQQKLNTISTARRKSSFIHIIQCPLQQLCEKTGKCQQQRIS